jgi:hypothetical protein
MKLFGIIQLKLKILLGLIKELGGREKQID